MNFLLKSEVESIDIQKNYPKKVIYCPICFKTQLKKLDSNIFYNKYQCWNKNCEKKDIAFVVINDYIQNEDKFDDTCENCQEPFQREFIIDTDQNLLLVFNCSGKMCDTHLEPYNYNLTIGEWDGKPPKFVLYDDDLIDKRTLLNKAKNTLKTAQKKELKKEDSITPLLEEFQEQSDEVQRRRIEDIPLLTMNNEEYNQFLECHQNRVVVLVDAPNFIRTLRELFPRNFEDVLKKSHEMLLQYIDRSFHTSSDYIIRYFSKPDKDLQGPNNIFVSFCKDDSEREFFHLLKLPKGGGFSDIDNYLIANGVEILERCKINGFIIVSSDKDYLPVMRIASYRKVKSRIIGINTPEIYEKHNITDIKFLGMMKLFEN